MTMTQKQIAQNISQKNDLDVPSSLLIKRERPFAKQQKYTPLFVTIDSANYPSYSVASKLPSKSSQSSMIAAARTGTYASMALISVNSIGMMNSTPSASMTIK